MGQPVIVVEKPSSRPGLVRFETNRTLSGSGHERFLASDTTAHAVSAVTPSAELARRLFATGQVDGVHVYQNMITVDLASGSNSFGLGEIVRDLHQYWKPGMVPPTLEELVGPEESSAPATSEPTGDGVVVDSRVPAHLIERSRLAREKWSSR